MLEFTKDMIIGIPKIDKQHEELVKMLDAFQSKGSGSFSAAETKKALDFLGSYVVKHFSDEEVLQRESQFPKHKWHKEQHEAFIAEFQNLKKEFDTNGASSKFTFSLNNKATKWVINHIKTADIEFGKHYQLYQYKKK